tara:strand:+ start:639 stop:1160 length:522 start_codon:yes stop_codon:yes gene_type:complete
MFDSDENDWASDLFSLLVKAEVSLFPYIPDAGNAKLIELAYAHNETLPILLTSEEEGVAVCAGADLVGRRSILCMQSSGVGNCPNILSLVNGGKFPILLFVSMRGDYGEENPWQYPMGQAVEPILHAMGVLTFRIDLLQDMEKATKAALSATGKGGHAAAIILSQKFLGAKAF